MQCQPQGRLDIENEEQLAGILAADSGPIRPVGSGHSFSPLVPTDGHLVVIDQLNGVLAHDAETHSATIAAGSRLGDLGPQLESLGQGMINLPDIDRQTLAGAAATGTHGTGVGLKNISAYVEWLRLITPSGQILDIDAAETELFNAARVNLGALGIVTQMRVQNRAAYKLKKKEWAAPTEDILRNFDELAANHRHFEIFPLVYSDYSMVLSIDESDEEVGQQVVEIDPDEAALISQLRSEASRAPAAQRRAILNRLAADTQPTEAVDVSYKLLSNIRSTPFNEMEYSVPIEVGADCVREILQTIFDKEIDVVFPLEYRYVSGDDCWLSMSQGVEPHATISIHRMAREDYRPYFDIIEPIFWKYGGRPHWGKIHSLGYEELRALYPYYDDFLEIRRSLDPEGRMLNPHLRKLFKL
ncbi:MAG: oxidoreductase [Pseudohongiella sp.]|nr:MAG: oxidoreductase [Pseudohongiella sp.]